MRQAADRDDRRERIKKRARVVSESESRSEVTRRTKTRFAATSEKEVERQVGPVQCVRVPACRACRARPCRPRARPALTSPLRRARRARQPRLQHTQRHWLLTYGRYGARTGTLQKYSVGFLLLQSECKYPLMLSIMGPASYWLRRTLRLSKIICHYDSTTKFSWLCAS